MIPSGRLARVVVTVIATAMLVSPTIASAHDHGKAGSLEIVFGWEHEPTFSEIPNAVHVTVLDADGEPVVDESARLTATVTYGDVSITRPLVAMTAPGQFRALLVPTEAGTYSFHIMGSIGGETVDLESTCSDETFDCVADSREVRFPAGAGSADADRSASQIAAAPDDDSIGMATIVALALSGLACVGVVLIGTGVWRPARRS
jgi:hypothetical protein